MTETINTDAKPQNTLEGGSYEVIRNRLNSQGVELRDRLGKLNAQRQAVFGAVEPSLIATERVTTEHKCSPRDIMSIGAGIFLFGYNVQIGLKSVTDVEDVFSVYQYDSAAHTFAKQGIDVIGDAAFRADLAYLYKYYRETSFVKFLQIGAHLYMAFRIGRDVNDIKCFKWLIADEGKLNYIGNRFDHEYRFPPQQDFEWVRAHRGMFREGDHPHISIEDRLFVETVGGDLTVKIEDNTSSGEGIYAESVTHEDQTLDDAEIFYAIVGSLILLKILPYQEKDYRYLVYNEKVKKVSRVDSIANSCVLLPEDHGLIFSDGYLLQTGEEKRFQIELQDMLFERRVASPNGEDYLYVFYNRILGSYILMSYNIIDQAVDNPIICHGYSLFPDGELVYFREDVEPQKHHVLQVWRTPFMAGDFRAEQDHDSYLYKIGNADIVKAMAECYEIINLIGKDDSYADLYIDLTRKSGDVIDSYFWCGHEEAFSLKDTLAEIRGTADSAIAEFDKVSRIRKSTAERTSEVSRRAKEVAKKATYNQPDDIMGFVQSLADLRSMRGEVISLRELRYSDGERIDELESELVEVAGKVSRKCVEFLLKPEALDPYRKKIGDQESLISEIKKVAEANQIGEELDSAGSELEMLIDIVGNLRIDDATETTRIIDDISAIYAQLNGVRAKLKNRRKDLSRIEGEAQFGAQMKLVGQAVVSYLDLCDSADKCDEYLSKSMVQLEELEGRFAEFEEYIEEIVSKRDEIYNAFESRKVQLVESRNKRANRLVKSADRILATVQHRIGGFDEVAAINGYLAGDLMVEKVRDIVEELIGMGDSVKADDLQTRLKTLREDAVRQLKDRKELFVDGENVIRLGNHNFNVNRQELELSIVPHDGHPCFHLAGTDFFEPITDEVFLNASDVSDMSVSSENRNLYRAEYLAAVFLEHVNEKRLPWVEMLIDQKIAEIQAFMAGRYTEGYTKGVHDQDAVKIFDKLFEVDQKAGLLRYLPGVRALAILYWNSAKEDPDKALLELKLKALSALSAKFPDQVKSEAHISSLSEELTEFLTLNRKYLGELAGLSVDSAAEYLFFELLSAGVLTASEGAGKVIHDFGHYLSTKRLEKAFTDSIATMEGNLIAQYETYRDWMMTVFDSADYRHKDLMYEAAALLAAKSYEHRAVRELNGEAEIGNMTGSHHLLKENTYYFDYLDFQKRIGHFRRVVAPKFLTYQETKGQLIEKRRDEMRLGEFKPKVMSSFVRNRLLDRVYLPLIGDNLAKQMGTAGDESRTDRMGMLLLISPPGYGKTTLMEYVANRLGVTFMKINGPAIGHEVTSLDPEDAPNASAREEIFKLNLSLEMGDNVMIYLDDIQHCNPEFLQKFISLCDAQRKIEGIWKGKPKTFDLRGKKVCVVMAGNPYTESGGKFQIPDMLANRADTYNLGDIIGSHSGDFEASYIENCITSNPILSRLSSQGQSDVYAIMKIAEAGSQKGVDFEGNYAVEEIDEMVNVMKKIMRVRDTILRVNLEYIRSAAMEDAYRTEPPFRLQGSYRNMNRLAEKMLPVMTDQEVEVAILDHYENESQTLTTGAEANLLKFREMEGLLTDEESARWDEIKRKFSRNLLLGGQGENDPVSRVIGSLSQINESLGHMSGPKIEQLESVIAGLRAVPVNVEIKVLPVEQRVPDEPPLAFEHDVEQS
ncbi:MAG: DNA repair ATPase [Verrucomicrobiales bacterium]|nr:DNA repair ATPase [Verrucomicrobiales bacterium]